MASRSPILTLIDRETRRAQALMGNRIFAWSSLDKSAAMVLKPCRRPYIILAAAGLVIWSIDAEAVSYTHLTLPTTPYV